MLFYSITKQQYIIIDYYKSLDIVFYDRIMSINTYIIVLVDECITQQR